MGLEQQLEDFKQEFSRTDPAGRPALYAAKIDELRSKAILAVTAFIALLPAVASLLAVPVLGEIPMTTQWAAIAMIGIGICLATRRPSFPPFRNVQLEGSNP
jgi:hypothetical protein